MILRSSAGVRKVGSGYGAQGAGGVKLYAADGTRKDIPGASAGGTRLPSLANPRNDTPSSYDDEFEAGTLDAKWSWVVDAGTSTPVTGDVDPVATVAGDPVYNLNDQWPSWLLLQGDNSTAQRISLVQSVSLDTDCTIVARIAHNARSGASSENDVGIRLTNSGDANEVITLFYRYGGTATVRFQVNNNGVITGQDSPSLGSLNAQPTDTLVIWKDSDVYYGGAYNSYSGWFTGMFTAVTKTGVTTLNQLEFFLTTDNATPSDIVAFDFVRYYPSHVLPPMYP